MVGSIAVAVVLTLINGTFEVFNVECMISYWDRWQLFFDGGIFYAMQYLAFFCFAFLIIFYLLGVSKLFKT
jgi:hypothetical protein